MRGHHREGWRWLEAGLAAAEQTGSTPPAIRAQAALSAATLAFWQADYTRATALAETSLALYQALEDPSGIAQALYALGSVAWGHNDFDQALPLLEQSLSLAREHGNPWLTMQAGGRLGIALSVQGNYTQADPLLEQSLMLAREQGDSQLIATLLMPLGVSCWQQGALERAGALFQEALVRLQYSGGRWFMPHPLMGLAAVAAREQPLRAARLMGAAKALADAVGTHIPPALQAQHDALASTVRSHVGKDAFCHAWEEGQAWPLEQLIDYALGRSSPR